MNRREYRIGPGAASLMLLVVVLSMIVLGMLALMSAHSDENLSRRSAEVAVEVAELNAAAERTLACTAEIAELGAFPRCAWTGYRLATDEGGDDEEIDLLFDAGYIGEM